MANPGQKLDRSIYINESGAMPLFQKFTNRESPGTTLVGFDATSPEESYIKCVSSSHRRKFGQFFTPKLIAKFMCSWVLGGKPETVLDPGCGTGIFVREIMSHDERCKITAVEVDPLALKAAKAAVGQSRRVKYTNADFLTWDSAEKFDGVIANPPYLKHHNFHYAHNIFKEISIRNGVMLSRLSNMYVLFVLEICRRLALNGRAAIIVPGEWVNANYGQALKKFLLSNMFLKALIYFSHSSLVFSDAMTTASIMLIEKSSYSASEKLLTAFVKENIKIDVLEPLLTLTKVVHKGVIFQQISRKHLLNEKKWDYLLKTPNQEKTPGFVPLSNFAETCRGIATGANKFFHVSEDIVRKWGIPRASLLYCIGKARDVPSFIFRRSDYDSLRRNHRRVYLLNFQDPLEKEEENYIFQESKDNLHKRYLLSRRTPWYSMEKREPAPIWAAVFGRKGLRFVYNEAMVRSLTTFHCIYPKANNIVFHKALTAVLNSRRVQHLAKRQRRVYGGGLAKFEPRDLLDICVPDLTQVSKETLIKLAGLLDELNEVTRKGELSARRELARLDNLVCKAGEEANCVMGAKQKAKL